MSEQLFNELSSSHRAEAMRLMLMQERLYEAHEQGYMDDESLQEQHQDLQVRLNYCHEVINNMNREFCEPVFYGDYNKDF